MTQTLDYARPLFIEQQPAGRVFPRMPYVMGAIAAAFIAACIVIAMFNRRLAMAFVPGLGIGAITCGFAAMMMFAAHAITIVEPSMIQLRLSVLGVRIWRRSFQLRDIRRVDVTDKTGQLAVLKTGVGQLNFMTRKKCVRLHLSQYRYIVIGSENPDELKQAVDSALASIRAGG